MAIINYLPFAMRENIVIPAGGSRALSIITAAFSGRFKGAQVEYQDVSFDGIRFAGALRVGLVRYGFEGRGYLIEEPISTETIAQGSSPGVRHGWRFARPYTLNPGQRIRIDYELAADGVFGAVLYGQRLDNGENILLAGSNIVGNAGNRIGTLTGDYFTCPADTPILIQGVSASGTMALDEINLQFGVQIYDGNGREVLTTKTDPAGTVTNLQMRFDWINNDGVRIELGRANGWELPVNNLFLLEIENDGAETLEYMVTVRGSLEVQV